MNNEFIYISLECVTPGAEREDLQKRLILKTRENYRKGRTIKYSRR